MIDVDPKTTNFLRFTSSFDARFCAWFYLNLKTWVKDYAFLYATYFYAEEYDAMNDIVSKTAFACELEELLDSCSKVSVASERKDYTCIEFKRDVDVFKEELKDMKVFESAGTTALDADLLCSSPLFWAFSGRDRSVQKN